MTTLGERIRIKREELGYSQEEIAEKLGLKSGRQTVYRWEKDKAEPSVSDIRRLADILKTTAAFLIDGIDTPPNVSALVEPPAGYILKSAEAELKEKEEKLQLQRELIEYQRKMLKTKDAELHEQKS